MVLPSPTTATAAGVLPVGRSLQILVAEDSVDNRLLLSAYLKGGPHKLTFVENGQAAVDRFTAGGFDLILMDIQMPVMDGLDATRAIRAWEKKGGLGRIPIVALTASVQVHDIQMTLSAGCDVHLAKPLSRKKLQETLAKYETPNSDA